jgi:hypothetical protein
MPKPRHDRSVTRRIGAGVTVAGVMALALSGCVGAPAPTPTPTASASAEPIFASDEEALAAAEGAYDRYLKTSTAVTNDGGADAGRLDTVAIGPALDDERAAAVRFQEQGLRTVGVVGFRVHDLQSVSADDSLGSSITLYVCDNLRGLDILGADGNSLVIQGRVVDVPYVVTVEGSDPDSLKVSEKELWTRDNFCLS